MNHWERLESAVGSKKKILVIGGGPTADVVLPSLKLAEYAVISTNEAYHGFASVIHVSTDLHCIDEWYQDRPNDEPVWVSRFADQNPDPSTQKGECPQEFAVKYRDIIPAKDLGPIFVKHTGSGPTALMIGWELARRLGCELITTGLDLGCFWKRNGPGQYASHVIREKERNNIDRNKPRWQYNFGPYQTQRKVLAQFAEYHRETPDAPRCISMSAINWPKLQEKGRIGEALDDAIIAKTIEYLNAPDIICELKKDDLHKLEETISGLRPIDIRFPDMPEGGEIVTEKDEIRLVHADGTKRRDQ